MGLDMSTCLVANGNINEVKNQNGITNSEDLDKAAHYKWSNQGLNCLCRYLVWFVGLNNLRGL